MLLYGSETWTLTTKLKSKIQANEMRVLCLIYGVTRRDRIRNGNIRQALKVESVLAIIERNQLRWYGYVQRMPDTREPMRTQVESKKETTNWETEKEMGGPDQGDYSEGEEEFQHG